MDDHNHRVRDPRVPLERRIARIVAVLVLLCVVVVSVAGCTTSLRNWARNGFKVGPNYRRPPAPVAPHWVEDGDPKVRNDPPTDCGWWTVFRDPTLNVLVDMAYRQNLDMRVAGTRILQAQAQRNIAVGNLFPQSQSALAAYAHGQITENLNVPLPSSFNVWATGFNASWELDFWGRYRRTVEANNADLQASVEQYGDTLILVLAEVATTYVELRTFEQRLDYAQQNVQIQKGSLQLAEARFDRGLATELDVRQARSSLAQTEATIPQLEIGRRQSSNRLCTLLGMPVGDLAAQFAKAPIPVTPPEIAIGLPAELLRRRPDIRQAEREVAAQSCAHRRGRGRFVSQPFAQRLFGLCRRRYRPAVPLQQLHGFHHSHRELAGAQLRADRQQHCHAGRTALGRGACSISKPCSTPARKSRTRWSAICNRSSAPPSWPKACARPNDRSSWCWCNTGAESPTSIACSTRKPCWSTSKTSWRRPRATSR